MAVGAGELLQARVRGSASRNLSARVWMRKSKETGCEPPRLRGQAAPAISRRTLDGYRKSQYADHGHCDQPRQPFHSIEAEHSAVAPIVRGHDITLPGL
jgi:hypothetical protein